MHLKELYSKFNVLELDEVKVSTQNEEFSGTIMESNNPQILVLKLKNGYNIGIRTERITRIEKKGEARIETVKEKKELKKVEFNPMLPKIVILQTGGTIASRIDYRTGGVIASVEQEQLVTQIPELAKIANIESKLVFQIMSEDMRFEHYKKIARAIEEELKNGAKGVIIGHGTDTIHYTCAALSFMLEGLNAPVLIVGAQRSSDRGSSDAAMNLVCAAEFIAQSDYAGVGICMHEKPDDNNCLILNGSKARKMHSTRRDAFKPINDIPVARINYNSRKIEFIKKDYPKKIEGRELKLKDSMEEKVALFKTHINMHSEQFEFYEKHGFKGLVIEGTGLGHAPIAIKEHEGNLNALKSLIEKGCVVVMTSQTIYGRVQLTTYTNLRKLREIGVLPGEDMTPETAFIKIAWLLGNYSKEEAKELIGKNLRGEITPCTSIEGFDVEGL